MPEEEGKLSQIKQEYEHCLKEFKIKLKVLSDNLKQQLPYMGKSIEIMKTAPKFDDSELSLSSITEFSDYFRKLTVLLENLPLLNKEQIDELIDSSFFADIQKTEKENLENLLSLTKSSLKKQEEINEDLNQALNEKEQEYLELKGKFDALKKIKVAPASVPKKQAPVKKPESKNLPRIAQKLFDKICAIVKPYIDKNEGVSVKDILDELKKEYSENSETYLSTRIRSALSLLAKNNVLILGKEGYHDVENVYFPNAPEIPVIDVKPKKERLEQTVQVPETKKEQKANIPEIQQEQEVESPEKIQEPKNLNFPYKPGTSRELFDKLCEIIEPLIKAGQKLSVYSILPVLKEKTNNGYSEIYLKDVIRENLKLFAEKNILVPRKESYNHVYYPKGAEIPAVEVKPKPKKEKTIKTPKIIPAQNQEKLLDILKEEPKTAKELSEKMNVSVPYLAYLLNSMTKSNKIKKCGKIKASLMGKPSDLYCLFEIENPKRTTEIKLPEKKPKIQKPKVECQKRDLNSYQERLLEILKEEPKTAREISKELKITPIYVHSILNLLIQSNKIKKCGTMKCYTKGPPADLYSLFETENPEGITKIILPNTKPFRKAVSKPKSTSAKLYPFDKIKESDLYKKTKDIVFDCLEQGTTFNNASRKIDDSVQTGKSMGTLYLFCKQLFESLRTKGLVSKSTEKGEYFFKLKVTKEELENVLQRKDEEPENITVPVTDNYVGRMQQINETLVNLIVPYFDKEDGYTINQLLEKLVNNNIHVELNITQSTLRAYIANTLKSMFKSGILHKKQEIKQGKGVPSAIYFKRQEKNEP